MKASVASLQSAIDNGEKGEKGDQGEKGENKDAAAMQAEGVINITK